MAAWRGRFCRAFQTLVPGLQQTRSPAHAWMIVAASSDGGVPVADLVCRASVLETADFKGSTSFFNVVLKCDEGRRALVEAFPEWRLRRILDSPGLPQGSIAETMAMYSEKGTEVAELRRLIFDSDIPVQAAQEGWKNAVEQLEIGDWEYGILLLVHALPDGHDVVQELYSRLQ